MPMSRASAAVVNPIYMRIYIYIYMYICMYIYRINPDGILSFPPHRARAAYWRPCQCRARLRVNPNFSSCAFLTPYKAPVQSTGGHCCEQSMPHIYIGYICIQLTFLISGSVPSLSASMSLVRLAVLSHSHRRVLTLMLSSLFLPPYRPRAAYLPRCQPSTATAELICLILL